MQDAHGLPVTLQLLLHSPGRFWQQALTPLPLPKLLSSPSSLASTPAQPCFLPAFGSVPEFASLWLLQDSPLQMPLRLAWSLCLFLCLMGPSLWAPFRMLVAAGCPILGSYSTVSLPFSLLLQPFPFIFYSNSFPWEALGGNL